MKHNSSKLAKPVRIFMIVCLMLSVAFQGSGVIGAQARSPQPPGDSNGPLPQFGKASLERLANLVNASVANGTGATDTAYLSKLNSHLQDMVSARLSGEDVTKTAQDNSLKISESQGVLMDVYVTGPIAQAENQLKGLGMQVLATNKSLGKVVEGYLPLDSVLAAAQLGSTKAFMPVMGIVTDTGSVVSQGDAAHNGPQARALGATGAGVAVGIVSDSMNQAGSKVAGSQATGDLPANVTVLADYPGGEDEGRAMAEIIYDTAPGITHMYFATAFNGAASRAASLNDFVTNGVKVVADDVSDYGEPFFQDGMVAQAVDTAYAAGVSYFASAGNSARQSYESNYRNDGNGYGYHNFKTGTPADDIQTIISVPTGGCLNLALQWDDPWGAATHDFDFVLFNTANLATPLAVSADDNIVTGVPFEFIHWCNSGSTITVGDAIDKYAGSDTAFLKYYALNNFGPFSIAEYNTASQSIGPDAPSASGALAVAAIPWNDAGLNDPETYSSRGPSITRFFNTSGVRLGTPAVRLKPNIAGTDCVATSHNYDGGLGFGGGTFCGTSAAAPSVAGVAALVLSASPSLTPSALYAVLTNPANTIDCTLAGNPDADCGYGFILADHAVAAVGSPTLTVSKTGAGSGTVISSPPGIDCGLTCSHAFTLSTPVTLSAVAATGSTFTGWSGSGCTGTGACDVTMSGPHSVTANFALTTTYTLNVSKNGTGSGTVTSSPPGIDCGATCSHDFASSTGVTLSAVASTGSTFTGWSGAGCSGTGTCGVTMTGAQSVTATFTINTYTLTVSKTGSGGGTVSSAPPGIDCGYTCSHDFDYNTPVTLSAAAAIGSTFTGWSGAGCSGTGTCGVTVSAARAVTAAFTINTYTLTVSKTGAGSGTVSSSPPGIDCGSTCSHDFDYNTPVTLSAVASGGSVFTGWSGSGCSGTGTCGVTMSAARSVTANFDVTTNTLSVSKAGNGSGSVTSDPVGIDCGATCAHIFDPDTLVTLSAAASTGSTFTGWSGSGCSGTGTCQVIMGGPHSVTATFTLVPYTLDVSKSGTGSGTVTSSPPGIDCGATCSHDFNYNTPVTLSAAASIGSTFTGWSGGGCSGTGTCGVTMTVAQSVTATFTINTYSLSVNKTGAGSGTVSSSPPGIDCGSTCSHDFDYNTPVTLSAVAAIGSTFTSWSGSGCSGTGTCQVTMSAAKAVTANFNVTTYALNVSKAGAGTGTVTSDPLGINCGSTCSHVFDYNTGVTLSAAASSGSTFAGWSGGGCSGTGTCVVNMTAPQSVTATFNISTYALTVNKTGFGLGTVTSSPVGIACGSTCSFAFNNNTVVTLTAAASTGSAFTGWSGAGCSGTGTCVMTIIAPQSVAANFNPPIPGKPVLISPLNGAQVNDNTPLLTWNSVPYGNTYETQVANNSAFSGAQDSIGGGLSYTATTLLDGKYYWRVRAINGNSVAGAWAASRNFTVDTTPPGMPLLTSPLDNAIVYATPAFKWKSVSTAKAYQCEYDDDILFGSPYVSSVLTTTSYTPPPMPLGSYYWRVMARDPAGNWSAWSAPAWIVNIHAPIPARPALILPLNGYLTTDRGPVLSWTPVANANIYEIQIDDLSTFASPILYGGITAATFDVTPDLALGKWYWRVRAINVTGDAGLWSSARTFTIH